jgi:hypothetical protein
MGIAWFKTARVLGGFFVFNDMASRLL